jgi:hypothetical protein
MSILLNKHFENYGDDDFEHYRRFNRNLAYKPILAVINKGESKMARERQRQSVETSFAEAWTPEKEGDLIEGIYRGSDIVKAKGRSFVSYKIQDEKTGKIRGVASAMLRTKMNQIPKGTYIWVTFKGMTDTENGPSRDYDVEVEKGTNLIDPFGQEGDLNEA